MTNFWYFDRSSGTVQSPNSHWRFFWYGALAPGALEKVAKIPALLR
jgi:acetylglutamate synthase